MAVGLLIVGHGCGDDGNSGGAGGSGDGGAAVNGGNTSGGGADPGGGGSQEGGAAAGGAPAGGAPEGGAPEGGAAAEGCADFANWTCGINDGGCLAQCGDLAIYCEVECSFGPVLNQYCADYFPQTPANCRDCEAAFDAGCH